MAYDWLRIYDYINEYLELVYNFYSKDAVAFLVTYYNLDTENTVWEDEKLKAGSYDLVGTYSGIKWKKILLLPVFFPEEISTMFSADERGYIKENETTMVIPSSYGITPYAHDLVKLEQSALRISNDTYPVFEVTGLEKSVNTDFTFWKLKIKIKEGIRTTDISSQVSEVLTFYEYTKKIYSLADAAFLAKLAAKSKTISDRIKEFYDSNSGLYYL